MNTAANNWQRAKGIVANALELSLPERHAYVEAQLKLAPSLRDEVESLLRVDTVEGAQSGFLQSPPVMPQESDEEKFLLNGQFVGAWKLIEEIGRGGMGVVYLAERADGAYSQRVAVKLLRGAGRQDASRMARERQALASLAHPNVARLFDGGTTTTGIPYLVMEYVEGETIERFAQQHQLSLEQRVVLVKKLCGAVQSAHQQLLIHRDIKPSNILVNNEGEPKLLDFGISRLLEVGKNSDDVPDLTQAGALLFTPRYASPEQVNGMPVSVATDVYGIGTLLYELLAGTSPYPRMATTDITNFAAIMRVVSQDSIGSASELAKINQPAFSPILKGDLDVILAKACAKLPQDRYPTIAALADDLGRWLEHRPITARSPNWVYLGRKFISRHPIGSVLSILAIGAIAAGAGGTIIQKNKALARYEQVREIPTRVITKYYDKIETLAGSTGVRRDMVNDALGFLDDLAKDADYDPRLAIDTAAGYRKMGEVMFNGRNMANLGDRPGGDAARFKAEQLLLKVIQRDPKNTRALVEMASVDADVAALLGSAGKVDDALIRFNSATKRYLLALEAPDKDGDVRFELIRTYLAAAAASLNDKKTAAPLLEQAKAQFLIWKAARSPDDKEIDNMQMFMYRIQYRQALAFEGYEAALKFSDAEIAIIDRYLVREPSNANHLQHKHSALLNSAVDLLDAKRAKEALVRIERAIPLGEKLIKVDADNANFSGGNARTFTHRGRIFLALEQPAEAKQAFLKSIELWKFADGRDVLPYMRRQQGEATFLLAREFFAEKESISARRYAQQFLSFAEKYPDIFSKEPGAKWVSEARLIAK